jgi:hypothetical protein
MDVVILILIAKWMRANKSEGIKQFDRHQCSSMLLEQAA